MGMFPFFNGRSSRLYLCVSTRALVCVCMVFVRLLVVAVVSEADATVLLGGGGGSRGGEGQREGRGLCSVVVFIGHRFVVC